MLLETDGAGPFGVVPDGRRDDVAIGVKALTKWSVLAAAGQVAN